MKFNAYDSSGILRDFCVIEIPNEPNGINFFKKY